MSVHDLQVAREWQQEGREGQRCGRGEEELERRSWRVERVMKGKWGGIYNCIGKYWKHKVLDAWWIISVRSHKLLRYVCTPSAHGHAFFSLNELDAGCSGKVLRVRAEVT
jgi:hypothetical protein